MGRASPPAALGTVGGGPGGGLCIHLLCRIPRKTRGGKEGATQFSHSVLGSVGFGSRLEGVRFCFTFQSVGR